MEKVILSREQLNTIPQETLTEMYLAMAASFEQVSAQLAAVQAQNSEQLKLIKNLQDNVAILTQKRFGRSTEKRIVPDGQLYLDAEGNVVDPSVIFNEAESIAAKGDAGEPEYEEVVIRRKKKSGKREEDISRLEKVVEPTVELPEDVLAGLFPKGYNRLKDEIYTDIEHIPERFIAHEHHYAVYGAKDGSTVVRASATKKPERLLGNSLLTPSLMAAVYDGRYALNLPINRISEDFARKDVNLSRQVLAGWVVRISDRYLRPLYRHLIDRQMASPLLHCDESPFVLSHKSKDDPTRVKAYMWVYHTGCAGDGPPIFVYRYEPGRKADYPSEHLKDYTGILMTDGYQVYHTLEKRNPDRFKVAGCWTHARRPFADYAKSRKEAAKGSVAEEALRRIQSIYHVDNMYKGKPPEERLRHRQNNVKPLVDAYFGWLNTLEGLDQGSPTAKAVSYSLNQETFLRRFLEDPDIPLDNNDAERSIRTFCLGKHACHAIDSSAGAESSAMMYSIVETAKANGLKPYEYIKYVLEQMLLHLDDDPKTYIEDISPWSDQLPACCRKLHM